MKQTIYAMSAAIALMTGSSAFAEEYRYTDANGNTMVIDSTAQTGSISGPLINASFFGSDLANFKGGALPTGTYNIAFNPGSTAVAGYQYGTGSYIAPNGTTYVPNNTHQPMLEFNGTNNFNVWAVWGTTSNPDAIVLGDYYWNNTGYTPPSGSSSTGGTTTGGTTTGGTTTGGTTGGTTTGGTTTGGTTTGGTTTGGTTSGGTTSGGGSTGGGSTGGTDVPAPGVLGLMAMAALGVGAARRRKK